MTPDERKAWEELVLDAEAGRGLPFRSSAILAADAELIALRSRVAVLEKVAEWACKKLDDEISFSKQHFESSTNEDCVCWLCDETAFAEIIRRRAKEG